MVRSSAPPHPRRHLFPYGRATSPLTAGQRDVRPSLPPYHPPTISPHRHLIASAPTACARVTHLAPFQHPGTPGCTLLDFHAGLCETEGQCAVGPRRRVQPAFFQSDLSHVPNSPGFNRAAGAARDDAAVPAATADAMEEDGGEGGEEEEDCPADHLIVKDGQCGAPACYNAVLVCLLLRLAGTRGLGLGCSTRAEGASPDPGLNLWCGCAPHCHTRAATPLPLAYRRANSPLTAGQARRAPSASLLY